MIPTVKLRSLTSLISSGATPKGGAKTYLANGPVMFIRSQNVRMGHLDLSDVAFISNEAEKEILRTRLRTGDVLLNITGASIGRVSAFNLKNVTSNVNQHVCVIRPDNQVLDSQYLAHVMATPDFQADINRIQAGGTRQALNFSKIANFDISLPPLPEQKRIAAILDKADALREKRRQAVAKLDELLQSVFMDMFGDPLSPKSDSIQIRDCAEIIMGQSPPGNSYNKKGDGIPLLNGPTEFGRLNPSEKQWTTQPKKCCIADDILFCVRGATAGRLNIADKPYCLGRGVAAIRPKPKNIYNSVFLFILLERYYDYFQARGVGSTFINISQKDLAELPIPSADESTLKRFKLIYGSIRGCREAFDKQNYELDKMVSSIQQRAFKGEL